MTIRTTPVNFKSLMLSGASAHTRPGPQLELDVSKSDPQRSTATSAFLAHSLFAWPEPGAALPMERVVHRPKAVHKLEQFPRILFSSPAPAALIRVHSRRPALQRSLQSSAQAHYAPSMIIRT